jgi:hypothetical protein
LWVCWKPHNNHDQKEQSKRKFPCSQQIQRKAS